MTIQETQEPHQTQQIQNSINENGINIKTIQHSHFELSLSKGRISNSIEMEMESINVKVPFPEMFFGHNQLNINYKNGIQLRFDASSALQQVTHKDPRLGGVQVSCAEAWKKARMLHDSSSQWSVTQEWDWTFTTNYNGDCDALRIEKDTKEEINLQLLKRKDPILFYECLPLYEDELGDNGSAILDVRVRVMPKCFLILLRFFLRVDQVLFRIIDTRYYHEYTQDYMIREVTIRETPYSHVLHSIKQERIYTHYSADGEDLSCMTNVEYVSSHMSNPKSISRDKIFIFF